MMDSAFLARMTALLTDKIADLQALSEASANDRAAVTLDQQSVGRLSRMDAMQQQAMAKATETRRQGEIQQLKAALARIAADDYGYCIDCGEDIAPARLEKAPAVLKCMSCTRG